ncbi:hypothetical protein [Nocardia sp. NPDC019255]|uniref:hypothetical protein n=1 Tax=Nocardia sp. NPDC019255 TaxID=3154591 RepID=UPI0033E456BB
MIRWIGAREVPSMTDRRDRSEPRAVILEKIAKKNADNVLDDAFTVFLRADARQFAIRQTAWDLIRAAVDALADAIEVMEAAQVKVAKEALMPKRLGRSEARDDTTEANLDEVKVYLASEITQMAIRELAWNEIRAGADALADACQVMEAAGGEDLL